MTAELSGEPAASVRQEPAARPEQHRSDAVRSLVAVLGCLLLAVPAGLLWSAVTPRIQVRLTADGPVAQDLEGKAAVGADGTFLLVVLAFGVLCGLLAWRFLRRGGPLTVLGLLVGGLLAARIAAAVGVRPGAGHVRALLADRAARGTVGLPPRLRAPWAQVGWPVGALLAFLLPALSRPEQLD